MFVLASREMFVLTSREMAETPQSAAAAPPSRVMNVRRFMSVARAARATTSLKIVHFGPEYCVASPLRRGGWRMGTWK